MYSVFIILLISRSSSVWHTRTRTLVYLSELSHHDSRPAGMRALAGEGGGDGLPRHDAYEVTTTHRRED